MNNLYSNGFFRVCKFISDGKSWEKKFTVNTFINLEGFCSSLEVFFTGL